MDDAFGNWLAGFIDGEGCFTIQRRKGTCHAPAFALTVREDDRAILETVHRATGIGRLYRTPPRVRPTGRTAGQVQWRVVNKAHVVELVRLLDRYPLRAKKSLDYALWREAVELWAMREGHGAGHPYPHPVQVRLAELKQAMEEGRRSPLAVKG